MSKLPPDPVADQRFDADRRGRARRRRRDRLDAGRAADPTRSSRPGGARATRFGATRVCAAAAAELYGDPPRVIDELGTLTSASSTGELGRWRRPALASPRAGQEGGDHVSQPSRLRQAAVAASRLGCDLVPLNTEFAGPQLADVLAREEVSAVFHDQEFDRLLEESGFAGPRIVGWHDEPTERPTIESLIAVGIDDAPPPRQRAGR